MWWRREELCLFGIELAAFQDSVPDYPISALSMQQRPGAQTTLATVLAKANFWQSIAAVQLNERQKQVLNRLLDGFEGKLTTSKWAKLAKCSQDTATRDMLALVSQGVLIRNAEGGRSTSYSIAACSQFQ